MRNGPYLQRTHCFILQYLAYIVCSVLCYTFYSYSISYLFVQQCLLRVYSVLGILLRAKMKWYRRWIWFLASQILAAFGESQKSKQRNMVCLTSAIPFGLLAFDLLSVWRNTLSFWKEQRSHLTLKTKNAFFFFPQQHLRLRYGHATQLLPIR